MKKIIILIGIFSILLAVGIALFWPSTGTGSALSVGLVRTTNHSGSTVAFITVTNQSSIPVIVHAVADSHRLHQEWHCDVSNQYPPLAAHAIFTVKIGVVDDGDAWRVRLLYASAPGKFREACMEFLTAHKLKYVSHLISPHTRESVVVTRQTQL